MLRLFVRFLAVAGVLWCTPSAHASAAGEFDDSFGGSGRVSDLPCALRDLRTQPDGKIVGYGLTGVFGPCVARFLSDGSLDPTFGGDGVVDAELGAVTVRGVAPEAAGSMLVGLESLSSPLDIVRLFGDGTRDLTFGSGGVLATNLEPEQEIALQSSGAIIVAGELPGPNPGVRVHRYLADGSLDTAFGVAGEASLDGILGTAQFDGVALAAQGDGGILVAAYEGVARLASDGSLDSSFGTGGLAPLTLFNIPNLALQSDGRIIVTGGFGEIVRLDTDGSLDATFVAGASPGIAMMRLLVQPDDRILIGGLIGSGFGTQVGLARYLPDGGTDVSFGDAGRIQAPLRAVQFFVGMTRLPDGRIAASSEDVPARMTLSYGGSCGDGNVDPGEDCDDGGTIPGDGCDPSCCVSDVDNDGRCDAIDPCRAPVGMVKTRLKLRGGPEDDHAQPIVIKGQMLVPVAPALDLPATGMRLLIGNTTRRVVDAVIPPGVGWTVSGRKSRWDGVAFPGIERVIVTSVPSTPGLLKVLIRGHGPYFLMGLEDLPLSFEVALSATATGAGQCGQATFPGPPPLPSCTQKGDIQVSCR